MANGEYKHDDTLFGLSVFLPEFLLAWGRYLILAAAAISGLTLANCLYKCSQLMKMRQVALGLHQGHIVNVRVADPYAAVGWTPPPPALARKLENALAAPRRPAASEPEVLDLLRVRYSGGFVADLAVRPEGRVLYIFYYDPAKFLDDRWKMPDEVFESRMPALTPIEAKWMREVGKSNPPPPLAGGDKK